MTTIRDQYRNLNLQINSQLKRAGIIDHKNRMVKTLNDMPESEWKFWITELIALRDQLGNQLN